MFWKRATEQGRTYAQRLATSATTLTHETLHHVFVHVNGVKVGLTDYHGDGVGGHPDKKFYGVENVTYLAQKAPGWAVRNHDGYEFFASVVGRP